MASVHEIKSEPLEGAEGVHEDLDEDIIVEHMIHDYEEEDRTPPIKEEVKEEIKTEPLVEDNINTESHVIDVERDQEKRDLQTMVDKLLLEKQTLLKDMD